MYNANAGVSNKHCFLSLFSSPEPKAHGELIVYQSSRRLSLCVSVCLSVNIFKLEYLHNQWANCNQILSEASLGRGKGCIRWLVICPCVSEKLMYNVVNTLAPSFLIGSSSFLQVTSKTIKAWTSAKFDQIRPWTAELTALERLEKSP